MADVLIACKDVITQLAKVVPTLEVYSRSYSLLTGFVAARAVFTLVMKALTLSLKRNWHQLL